MSKQTNKHTNTRLNTAGNTLKDVERSYSMVTLGGDLLGVKERVILSIFFSYVSCQN